MKGMNRISLTAGLCVLASQCLAGSEGGNRNILLIMADDMGAMELGCYGNEINRTPNIDRLAEEGMMFSTFFATPVSTPSRVALMTGKYGIHTGHLNMSNLPGGRGRGYDLSTDEYTFGQMFSDAGYSTVLAGKWQLSGKGETLIKECGFDEYMAWIYKDNLAEGVVYRGGYFPEGTTKTSRYWYPGIMTNGKHIGTSPEDYGPDMYSAFLMDFIWNFVLHRATIRSANPAGIPAKPLFSSLMIYLKQSACLTALSFCPGVRQPFQRSSRSLSL